VNRLCIFISSAQKEFAEERRELKAYLHGDPLLRRFFEVFLFEDIPASDRRADSVYLDEVDSCDIYVGLFGQDYGYEDAEGISPTEREFDSATAAGKPRLIFIKGQNDDTRHPKMRELVRKAGKQLIRRRFTDLPELTSALYASLVEHLVRIAVIQEGPFDGSACPRATFEDLSTEKLDEFLARAQSNRGYPLGPGTAMRKALTHLDLLAGKHPSHAAVLLFGKLPQRFLVTSEVKCLHFHGTEVRKPIPSYQIYKGNVFELVDQALDFVMSKIARSVGTREQGPQAPVEYELPREAVGEAIVNAIAHRDYTSNASVQVMLFADRLEVWNPGQLPATLTLASLRVPHASIPHNPLLAGPLFLAGYIEKAGTGTLDMIARCAEAELPTPDFRQDGGQFVQTLWRPVPQQVAGEVIEQVGAKSALSRHQVEILEKCREETALVDLMVIAQRSDRTKFRHQVLSPLIEDGLIEMTIPDKPQSSKQKYRLTEKGRALQSQLAYKKEQV